MKPRKIGSGAALVFVLVPLLASTPGCGTAVYAMKARNTEKKSRENPVYIKGNCRPGGGQEVVGFPRTANPFVGSWKRKGNTLFIGIEAERSQEVRIQQVCDRMKITKKCSTPELGVALWADLTILTSIYGMSLKPKCHNVSKLEGTMKEFTLSEEKTKTPLNDQEVCLGFDDAKPSCGKTDENGWLAIPLDDQWEGNTLGGGSKVRITLTFPNLDLAPVNADLVSEALFPEEILNEWRIANSQGAEQPTDRRLQAIVRLVEAGVMSTADAEAKQRALLAKY